MGIVSGLWAMIKSRVIVFYWYLAFLLISCASVFLNQTFGLVVFLIGCVIFPFYFCHFLSGYIYGRIGGGFRGNLLINLNFLKFIKTTEFAESDLNDVVSVFFLWYSMAILCLIISFLINMIWAG